MPKITRKDDTVYVVTPKALLRDERLSVDAKVLWLYLASMDFAKRRNPNPSQTHLGTVLGRQRKYVRLVLDELERFGALKRKSLLGKTCSYDVVLPERFYLRGSDKPTTWVPETHLSTTEPGSHRPTKDYKLKNRKEILKDFPEEANARGRKKVEEMKRKFGL